MNRRTTGRRTKPGALRCSACGIEVEERWEEYDIMKPGGNCCQSAKVGRIGTRENYCYGEPALSSLAAEL